MKEHINKRPEYQKAIKAILLHEWDPIGVSDEPEAQGEYDAYVQSIYALLINHENEKRIFDYLWKTETEDMELPGDRIHTEQVVKSLLKLKRKMEN